MLKVNSIFNQMYKGKKLIKEELEIAGMSAIGRIYHLNDLARYMANNPWTDEEIVTLKDAQQAFKVEWDDHLRLTLPHVHDKIIIDILENEIQIKTRKWKPIADVLYNMYNHKKALEYVTLNGVRYTVRGALAICCYHLVGNKADAEIAGDYLQDKEPG